MKGVNELSKMQNLQLMHIKFERHGRDENEALALIVHAAGRVPNLKKFDYELTRQSVTDEFVVKFGLMYKEKKLMLCNLRSGKLVRIDGKCSLRLFFQF